MWQAFKDEIEETYEFENREAYEAWINSWVEYNKHECDRIANYYLNSDDPVRDNLDIKIGGCEHEDIEWGDDDERGVCKNCGATCDWHWEQDVDDNYPDYIKEIKTRVPDEWHKEE